MLCVIARIDEGCRERLLGLQERTVELGIPRRNLYGHITVASYIGEDEEGFIASCKEILRGHGAFDVCYERIEVLYATSIVVASPAKEGGLAAVHRDIVSAWGAELDKWSQEDVWHPHTTLVHDLRADLDAAAKVMRDGFAPFPGRVGRIEFSRVKENGYEIVDHVDLA